MDEDTLSEIEFSEGERAASYLAQAAALHEGWTLSPDVRANYVYGKMQKVERRLTAALAREKALREALEGVVHDVQEWCSAVERDSSWDGWDEHYKDFAYRGGLDAARAALSTTPTA
jgi:hypothetical protein